MSPELNLSHDSPNLMAKGYDISSDSYSPTVDFTTGTDFENNCFFPTMAPVCKDLGAPMNCQLYLPIRVLQI